MEVEAAEEALILEAETAEEAEVEIEIVCFRWVDVAWWAFESVGSWVEAERGGHTMIVG